MSITPPKGAALLAAAMRRRRLTQGAVEALCGFGSGTVSRYLSGRCPDLMHAAVLRTHLRIPLDAWLADRHPTTAVGS